jgi:hypothetical protein
MAMPNLVLEVGVVATNITSDRCFRSARRFGLRCLAAERISFQHAVGRILGGIVV